MRKLKICVAGFLFYMLIALGAYYCGHKSATKQAFEDIILERCWLNKQSRDIECIQYITD